MSSVSAALGQTFTDHPTKSAFLKWQCHIRQLMMREGQGRPVDGIMPHVILSGEEQPLGQIITILNKSPGYSVTPELVHMNSKTHDPAQKRDQALQYFSATYYQRHKEFSDILTATFPPGSPGAAKIRAAGTCTLIFEAYSQRFDLACKVWRLAEHNPLFAATMAHNRLFNQALPSDSVILGFEPDWSNSTAS